MSDMIFTNARVVTADQVVDGTVHVQSGEITEVSDGRSNVPSASDIDGDYLLPGFVELHTDNLEKHFAPRPGVSWPQVPAVLAHDAQLAAAGITTVLDALSVGDLNENSGRLQNLTNMATAIADARDRDLLRADHFLHLRCEVSHGGMIELFEDYQDDVCVRLVSLMDHTPGQRQFTRLDKYAEYFQGKYGMSDDQLTRFMDEKRVNQERYSAPNRAAIVERCRERGIPMASHDDATPAHVDEALDNGVTVAEFPTTVEAATKAHDAGLKVLMGAPNIVLGGSHSGNVSAMDLGHAGVLDIVSSDYVPSSIIQGVFRLWREGAKKTLPDAVATVSKTPADIADLTDRGEIAAGRKADLIRVAIDGDTPVVVSVWREGIRVI